MLPDNRAVLAYESPYSDAAVTVYSYSMDRPGVSTCTGACAVTWPPLLTRGTPTIDPNLTGTHIVGKDLGFIRLANGTEQATYEGKPLYLYSDEIYTTQYSNGFQNSVTTGNGNGLHWPRGGTFSAVYLDK
jgi:predicted lipoprotein with Yx(FWY)xxD motif